MNIKSLIDWDDPQKVEQLTLYLHEVQTELESKMTQSIEAHILGKQKAISVLADSLPILKQQSSQEIKVEGELDALI
jgi:hypothetical protein